MKTKTRKMLRTKVIRLKTRQKKKKRACRYIHISYVYIHILTRCTGNVRVYIHAYVSTPIPYGTYLRIYILYRTNTIEYFRRNIQRTLHSIKAIHWIVNVN